MKLKMFVLGSLCLICFLCGQCVGKRSSDDDGRRDRADFLQPKRLYILSLLPYRDPSLSLQPSWDEGQSVFLAKRLAVEHINNRTDILPGYQIELIQANGGCNVPGVAQVSLFEQVLHSGKQVVGIIGPGCSSSAIAISSLTSHKHISLVNFHLGSSITLKDPKSYPYSFGIRGGAEALEALLALIKHNNWTRVAILYDESRPFYTSVQQLLVEALQQNPAHSITFSSAVYESFIPLDAIEKEGLRILVLLLGPDLLSRVACLGYHRGFIFPDYQVITPFEAGLSNTTFIYDGRNYSCDQDILWKSSNGHFVLTYHVRALNKSHIGTTGYSYEQFNYLYEKRVQEYNRKEGVANFTQNYWAPSFYDAVWALALALNQSTDPRHTQEPISLSDYTQGQPQMTEIVREQIETLDFEGVSGKIDFEKNTGFVRRVIAISLYSSERRTAIPVGYYDNNTLYLTANSTVLQLIPDFLEENEDDLSVVEILLSALFLFLVTLELMVLVTAHILSIAYRHSRPVKASSPRLNHLAFIGSYCLIVTIVCYIVGSYLKVSAFTCALLHFQILIFVCGGDLIFGVVLVRTWRLYRILVQFRDPGRFISDFWLTSFVMVLSGGGLLLNFVWIGVDKYRVERDSDGNESCEATHEILWFGLSASYGCGIALAGVWYAVRCHNTPTPRKEFRTTNVIFLAYSNILIQAIGFPIYILSVDVDLLAFVTLCLVGLLLVLSSFMLLVPPVWPVFTRKFSAFCLSKVVDLHCK